MNDRVLLKIAKVPGFMVKRPKFLMSNEGVRERRPLISVTISIFRVIVFVPPERR
jgi:hypothetical protein